MQEKERYIREMLIYKATHPAADDQAEGSIATMSTATNGNDDDGLSAYTDEEDDEPLNKDNQDDNVLSQNDDSSQDDDDEALSQDENDDHDAMSSDDNDDGSHTPIKDRISDTESSDDSDTSASINLAPRVPQKHKMPKHIITKQKHTIVKPKDAVTKPKNAAVKPKENVTKPMPKEPVKSSIKQSSMKNNDKSTKDKGKQPMIRKNNVKQNDKNKQTIMDNKAGQIQKQGIIKKKVVDKSVDKGKQPMNVMKKRPSSSTNNQLPSKKAKKSKIIKALKLAWNYEFPLSSFFFHIVSKHYD